MDWLLAPWWCASIAVFGGAQDKSSVHLSAADLPAAANRATLPAAESSSLSFTFVIGFVLCSTGLGFCGLFQGLTPSFFALTVPLSCNCRWIHAVTRNRSLSCFWPHHCYIIVELLTKPDQILFFHTQTLFYLNVP